MAYQLGDLNETAGHFPEAAQEYETALAASSSATLSIEVAFRLGRVKEQLGDTDAALRAYQIAIGSPDRQQPYRLSAVARAAALYEAKKDRAHALAAYKDIVRNAKDPELVAAAQDRAAQLEGRKK